MALKEMLAAEDVFVALEITPPKTPRPEVLLRRASLLAEITTTINVIQRPGRQSSLDASCELRAAGYEPVWHLVARGEDAHDLPAAIERATAAGVDDVLCILGDRPGEAAMRVRDMVAAVWKGIPGACVGATMNQYAVTESAMANLYGKIEAGATFVETQPAFGLERLAAVVEPARKRFPDTGFVAMAMPLVTPGAASRMEARLGFAIPESYREQIARGPEAAWRAFAENLGTLRASGLVSGIAIMTPEMDPGPTTAARIRDAVVAAGLARVTAH